jgi:glycerophosphoryl diester phosphodiesterase
MAHAPRILAHRGASGYAIENSLAAFRRAIELGADGVELDVHATSDGELVVHHDAVIEGLGAIRDLSLDAIRSRPLSNGETVPTLEEALGIIGVHEVWIELKALPPSLEGRLLRVLHSAPAPGRYGIHSFDHRLVRRISRASRDFRTGILLSARLLDPVSPMQQAGASVLWQEWSMIDAALIADIHAAHGAVIAWTVNDHTEAANLAALGVDGLCGNYPDRLKRS